MAVRRLFALLAVLFALHGSPASLFPAAAQYDVHFGRNKIQHEDFDWHVLKTEHFDVYYYPQMKELAEHGAFFAEEAYDELRSRFDFSLTRRVPLIFYSSNIHFKQTNITPGFIPDGVGGFFEFLKGRVVIPANGDLHRFRRVVRHELVHVFTYAKVLGVMRDHRVPPDHFLPLWFTEGLAEYWSGSRDHQHEMILRDAVASNYLVPMENMYRIHGTYQMYKQGEAIFHFVSQTYGEEKILQMIENSWKDRDFHNVMELVLQEPFQTVADRWLAWLKDQYYPRLKDAELATLIAEPVAARGFNAKPTVYTFPDGTRKVYFVGNHSGYSNVYEVEVDSAYRPVEEAEVLVRGERSERFEAFHLLESRISVSKEGRLAFVTKSGGRDVIHVYDLLGDRMGPTYRFDRLVAVYSPSWSPDGTQLTFTSIDESGFSDLYLFDTEENHLRRLTSDAYDDRDPAWSPDGRFLAFSSDRTVAGRQHAYNLFLYDLRSDGISYLTYGQRNDASPRWSPDGRHVVFTSTQPDSAGRFSAQDVWVADVQTASPLLDDVATASVRGEDVPAALGRPQGARLRRLTGLTSAAHDPVWTPDDRIVFTSFEHYRFSVRQLDDVDSLLAVPREVDRMPAAPPSDTTRWAYGRIGSDEVSARVPYRRKYDLDVAQGQVSQNPVWGSMGGAMIAFSDLMGDDYWYLTVYNSPRGDGNVLQRLNFNVTRVQLHRRANVAYGLYRFSGQRYDVTDPDVGDSEIPIFQETLYGTFGAVSYPLSKFRRVGVSTSFNWSDKEDLLQGLRVDRRALLLSNSVSLVHDNALYGMNGPVDGWRANVTAAYTTDVLYSNVNYYTLTADVRHYWRFLGDLTFASRGLVRANVGRRARLFILGGSWDLRGWRLFDVRGRRMWFTSQELRFPILRAPSLYLPLLAPFGVANLRGAFFFDAAHAWNGDYYDVERRINTGETLGSFGAGLRVNLFGGLVLRYDVGWRYRQGFRERDRFFKQFFFGWDF